MYVHGVGPLDGCFNMLLGCVQSLALAIIPNQIQLKVVWPRPLLRSQDIYLLDWSWDMPSLPPMHCSLFLFLRKEVLIIGQLAKLSDKWLR